MISLVWYILPVVLGALRVAAPLNNAGLLSVAVIGSLPMGVPAAAPRYVPKWKKQACEIPAEQHPKSHYVCDETGEVKCLPGWIGDLCDVPLCRKGCDPLQGYCRRPNECRCKLGFYGDFCDKCIALPGCAHGRCNVSFECACDPGWKGLFCSEPICDSDCHPSQSYCEKPGECRCRLGWHGAKCKECQVMPGCVHGTCQGPLECRCDPGWTGFLCQTPICAPGCSSKNGGCRKPGTCRCRVGWTGQNCTQCHPYPGCVHGTCERPWECRCKPGWDGDLCDIKLTYCDDHLNTCQNNGTCISMTKENGNFKCICHVGYVGRKCQIEIAEPATDLTPPMPAIHVEGHLTTSSSTQQSILSGINENSDGLANNSSSSHINLSQGGNGDGLEDATAEPLGPIVITDPPITVELASTAGKWPTESPTTENSIISNDADNEA